YFMASEEDLRTGLGQPWTSIGLDAGEMSLDGPIYEAHGHPRAMGSMPRFLGRYVRDEHLMPLEAAIRKITSLPAQREHLDSRGLLKRLLCRYRHFRSFDDHRPCNVYKARPAFRRH